MRTAVSNASPLILLAKIGALDLMFHLFDEVFVPPTVYEEAVEAGLRAGRPDALPIKELVDSGRIRVVSDFHQSPKLREFDTGRLHPGEFEAIDLALSLPGIVILLDDEEARNVARFCHLNVKGTLGILVACKEAGKIGEPEAIEYLDGLNEAMYLSGDLYRFVERKLRGN
ncbi:MAG: DUF3368 domain-containing protein [Promethearchaeota archaeon]